MYHLICKLCSHLHRRLKFQWGVDRGQLQELCSTQPQAPGIHRQITFQATASSYRIPSSYPFKFKDTASIQDESLWQHTQTVLAEGGAPQTQWVTNLQG